MKPSITASILGKLFFQIYGPLQSCDMSILNINSMYVQCTYFEIENRHGIDKDFQAVSPFFEALFIIFNICIQYFDIIFFPGLTINYTVVDQPMTRVPF